MRNLIVGDLSSIRSSTAAAAIATSISGNTNANPTTIPVEFPSPIQVAGIPTFISAYTAR